MSVSNVTSVWPHKTAAMISTRIVQIITGDPPEATPNEHYYWFEEYGAVWCKYLREEYGATSEWTEKFVQFITPPDNLSSLVPAGAQVLMIAFFFGTYTSQSDDTNIYINPGTTIPTDAQAALSWADTTQSTLMIHVPKTDRYPCGTADAEEIAEILEKGVFVAVPVMGSVNENGPHYIETQITFLDPTKAPLTSITEPADLVNRKTEDPLTVSWTYEQEASSPQTGAVVQGSTDGITWTTLGTVTGTAGTCTIPANTLTAGDWILRVTVSSASASATSDTVRVKMRTSPATSDVTCDGRPVPTVEWTGADQTAYQVRFDTWDSGAIFGSEDELTVPRVYPDGVYPVTVRTQTSNGEWSEWSETVWAEISNTDPGLTVSLTAVQSGGTVLTAWPAVTGAAWYVLERDGVPVYAGTGLSFRDDLAVGAPAYRLLAVTSGGYYTATDPVTVTLALRCDMLLPLDDDTAAWIRIRWSLAARSRSYDRSVDTTFRHYAGRERPMAISSGASTRTMRTTAAFKTRAEAEALLALAGRPVVYKDVNGGRIIGIINPVGYDSEHVYSLDISVTEIDWPEEAEYVPAE